VSREIAARHATQWPGVYIEVDGPRRAGYREVGVYGMAIEIDDTVTPVHVISDHAGGEIRGYALVHGRLWLRKPCHTGLWPEMDAAVSAALGAAVAPETVASLLASGLVDERDIETPRQLGLFDEQAVTP